MTTRHQQLLDALKARGETKNAFGLGLSTADRYVRTISECVGADVCQRLYKDVGDLSTLIKQASDKLVISTDDMVLEKRVTANADQFKEFVSEGIEIPKNTLMVFRHVLTTPRKDRDGDILRTQGAEPDPKMLLLWQHIHTLPIGKMLEVVEHNEAVLRNVSAIVDMGELAHDAAVMMDNGMGRFSHGFRAIEWTQLKDEPGNSGALGFDIRRFEIMEESVVSVPSNVDAEEVEILMTLHDRKQVKSDVVRGFIEKTFKSQKQLSLPGVDLPEALEVLGWAKKQLEPAGCKCDGECTCKTDTTPSDKERTIIQGLASFSPEDLRDLRKSARIQRGTLEGSWEWTEKHLQMHSRRFMESVMPAFMRDRFVWVAATFESDAIICTEHERSGVPDEFVYWRASWSKQEEIPMFTGDPTQVEVNVSIEEVRDLSPFTKDKQADAEDAAAAELDGEKVGRTLSRANLQKLVDVRDDLMELGDRESFTRAGSALCERCVGKLNSVIDTTGGSSEDDDERSTELDLKSIMLAALTADPDELANFIAEIDAMKSIAERSKQTAMYTSVVSASVG